MQPDIGWDNVAVIQPKGSPRASPDFDAKQTDFVGLVNQGATCYLNSLLQSLYMTPQFRSALFTQFTYDPKAHGSAEFCITYQLQLLFARLKHGKHRAAIATQPLTHAFRWTAADAFQQHDVQELMRVLFNALERTTAGKQNGQSDLFSRLYEGYMKDYLRCRECNFSRERRDKFLDLSLDVKNMGSLQASLKAFIQPEILEKSNQWLCSQCNKKVDAEKGLSLDVLPEILTLQLKRFVFDYEINARVKLHDEFCFEETMDLSSLLSSSSPSVYELIAVMVHSGSAVGGHYYAYIKDVQAIDTDKQWFEFNDARVSAISLEDMRRGSFGGANKASAYMLMYRKQCDSTMADAEAPLPLQEQVAHEESIWLQEKAAHDRHRNESQLTVYYQQQQRVFRVDRDLTLAYVSAHIMSSFQSNLLQAQIDDIGVGSDIASQSSELHALSSGLLTDPLSSLFRLRRCELISKDPSGAIGSALFADTDWAKPLCQAIPGANAIVLLETRDQGSEFPAYRADDIHVRVRVLNNRAEWDNIMLYGAECDLSSSQHALLAVDRRHNVKQLCSAVAEYFGIADELCVLQMQENKVQCLDDESISLQQHHLTTGSLLMVEPLSPVQEQTAEGNAALTNKQRSAFIRAFEESRTQISISFNLLSADTMPDFNQITRLSRTSALSELRVKIAQSLNVSADSFKMRRCVGGAELKDNDATLESLEFSDGSVVFVAKGVPLKPDEVALKFSLYDVDNEKKPFTALFELPIKLTDRVSTVKQRVLTAMQKKHKDIEFVRLRERTGLKVGKILVDEQTMRQSIPSLTDGKEIAVQRLASAEVVSINDISVFVQRWHSGKGTTEGDNKEKIGSKVELMVFKRATMSALRAQIASALSMDVAHVGLAKGSTFSKMELSALPQLKWDDDLKSNEAGDLLVSAPPLNLRGGDLLMVVDRRELNSTASAAVDAVSSEAKGASEGNRKPTRAEMMQRARQAAAAKNPNPRRGGFGDTVFVDSVRRFKEQGLQIYTDEDAAAIEAAMAEDSQINMPASASVETPVATPAPVAVTSVPEKSIEVSNPSVSDSPVAQVEPATSAPVVVEELSAVEADAVIAASSLSPKAASTQLAPFHFDFGVPVDEFDEIDRDKLSATARLFDAGLTSEQISALTRVYADIGRFEYRHARESVNVATCSSIGFDADELALRQLQQLSIKQESSILERRWTVISFELNGQLCAGIWVECIAGPVALLTSGQKPRSTEFCAPEVTSEILNAIADAFEFTH